MLHAFDPITIALTGNQTGVSAACAPVVRCDNASVLTLLGIAAGYSGQRLTIVSVGAGQVDIANESSTETIAANRIITGVTGTISLAAGVGRAELEYDTTTARWRVVMHEQGAYITPAFSAADYAGNVSMTWTVGAGDVTTCAYYLKGRMLTVMLSVVTTTVGGTLANGLTRVVPGGFVSAKQVRTFAHCVDNGTVSPGGLVIIVAAGTLINFFKNTALANWSAATDATEVYTQVTFEVQ